MTSNSEKTDQTTRPVRFMNDEARPLTWPIAAPASLGEDARTLYSDGHSIKLDRDYFAPRARSWHVARDTGDKYEPTPRDLAAIAEIEAYRLGSFSKQYKQLSFTPTRDDYTVVEGRGSQYVEVYVHEGESLTERRLLAVLVGADLEMRGAYLRTAMRELVVRARHEDATDFEHDASSTALLTILNPTPAEFTSYGRVTLSGLLTEAKVYSLGVDPLAQSDEDMQAGEVCTACFPAHPFAPYLPPELLPLGGRPLVVDIECLPIRPYLMRS